MRPYYNKVMVVGWLVLWLSGRVLARRVQDPDSISSTAKEKAIVTWAGVFKEVEGNVLIRGADRVGNN